MKLPDTITISGNTYEVVVTDYPMYALGHYDEDNQQIVLDGTIHAEKRESVFFHECAEVIKANFFNESWSEAEVNYLGSQIRDIVKECINVNKRKGKTK